VSDLLPFTNMNYSNSNTATVKQFGKTEQCTNYNLKKTSTVIQCFRLATELLTNDTIDTDKSQ